MPAAFIGRTEEIEAIAAAMGDGVVTVVGPGGVGKTATALRVADGHPVVELASLTTEEVPAVLAGAASKTEILVIDNAEHVVTAVADWLSAHPDVPALVTSRVPLRVPNERVIELRPLSPIDAAALFVERASRAGASPSDQNAIHELCTRLDHLPLAIELAAARARLLSPAAMTARLDDRFRVLAEDPHPAQEHHRTLRAAIEWSYDLLGDAERDALRRLSVFADRFGLDQAEHIGVDLDTLDALVSHSLVMTETDAAMPFRLLESVRAFALVQVEGDPLDDLPIDGLVRWLDHASAPLDRHDATERDALHARLDIVATDVRRAIEHAAVHDAATAVALFGRLGSWYWDRGRATEGLRVGELVMNADPGDDGLATARLLNALANLAVRAGDPQSALALYEHALDLRVKLDASPSQLASTRNDLGACYLHLGELDKAEDSLIAARAGYESVGDRWGVATTTSNLAAVAVTGGHLEGAARAFADAAAEFTKLGDHVQAAAGHTNRGLVLLELGDSGATTALAAALRLILRAGVRAVLPAALAGVATSVLRDGDALRAARLFGAAETAGFVDDGELRTQLEDAAGIGELPRLIDEGRSAGDDTVLAWAEGHGPLGPVVHVANEWRKLDHGWSVTFAGQSISLPDVKGVQFIARLLAQPGHEFHATELMGSSAIQSGTEAADDAALAAYRQRILELHAELDAADNRGDAPAGAKAQSELDHLAAELRRATSKTGRVRLTGDDSERARKAVGNRVRDAIRLAAEVHPALGRHLEKAVVTGTFCSYTPETPIDWIV